MTGRVATWLGVIFSVVYLSACGKRAAFFTTPYDRELRRALNQQKGGWVSAGQPMDTLSAQKPRGYLLPGQFIRVVIELPHSHITTDDPMTWQTVRMDTLRVFEDSLTYLPWAGAVRLGGLSIDSARAVLQDAASRIFIGAKLRLYPMYAYYFFGQVSQQGRILSDKSQMPLLEFFHLLNVQAREADISRVKVFRGPPKYAQVFLVDARDAAVLTSRFLLQAEDIVVLEQRDIVRGRIELQNLFVLTAALQLLNLVLLIINFFP
ncbi:MAG: hypothetical protein NZZ60_08375 [Bacteroidia bacterium]|nr:hypothetical protein [Bacteroidia bacterium]MCX7651953.1 hypothetical protein [Bacteroidia bacterium]MDW8416104.1 hypothetical protein [Bacteroidia bacterium]